MRTLIMITSLLFLVVSKGSGQADGTDGLTVKGIVTKDGQKLGDARIRVFNGQNRLVEQKRTRRDGSFRVRLALDGYYVVEFSKSGTVKKRLLFKTHTPTHDRSYHPFNVEILLFDQEAVQKHPEVDLDLPLGIIEYFPEKEDFDYVKDYTTKRLKEQKGLLSDTP